jgi:hypothetical protein
MAKRLEKDDLAKLVNNVINPKGKGFSEGELNQQLLLFSINCPDPVGAMDLVIEAHRGVSPMDLVEKALAMPRREAADVPESQLALTHPLRQMKLNDK